MLSPNTQYNLRNAKEYFEEHLCAGDYYSEEQTVAGQWLGEGAKRLRLSGKVKRDEFLSLCENLNPSTGELLTQRLKTTRAEARNDGESSTVANRRVFYDFTFSPPKSVSIAAFIGNDTRIVEAHDRAVTVALRELERFAATRVRVRHNYADRQTGNVVCAVFQHHTSRALDPHLHSHCIVFNATHDAVEARWKALQNFDMLRAQKFVENVYYHELARDLRGFGYDLVNQPRGDFEIRGISKELCQQFSKRHQEIDEKTQELLARKTDLARANIKDVRETVAHNERSRKIKGIGENELREHWRQQLSPADERSISAAKSSPPSAHAESVTGDAVAAVTWAEDHLFDRRSVVPEYELWRHALEHVRGGKVSLTDIQKVTRQRDYVRNPASPYGVTTQTVLDREWDIVSTAREGIRQYRPFSSLHGTGNPGLDQDQRQAVEHILGSRDFVTLFRGGAGTGKSYALGEVQNELRSAGHALQVIAPQRQQVIALQHDGMTGAQTVSEFLTKRQMPRGAVVIADEAGQIGAKQMQQLLHYAQDNGSRVILSGDTRQHGPVEASDALWAIEKYSGIKPAELKEIRRQDPAHGRTEAERKRITEYKQAVKEASEGKLDDSFRRLDRQGAIVECSAIDRQERLAEQFLALTDQKQSVVVVSQTWSEIHKVNDSVRSALKSRGLLAEAEQTVTALEPVDLTDAQKRDRRFYDEQSVVLLNRDAGGLKKGQTARLVDITRTGLVLERASVVRTIPFKFVDRVTVCQPRTLPLATGDRLQLKANATATDGRRVANGELVTVEQVLLDGRIRLRDGRTLARNYRQFVRGFAITSYASQGKTVDYVLFSDSTIKPATNRQQWYVTISRGRRGIKIFTSDKAQLHENILRSGDRELAVDFAAPRYWRRLGISQRLLRPMRRMRLFALGIRNRIRATTNSRRPRAIEQNFSSRITA
ncbi:MAG: Multifunctional conjugation protein TraI [Verrucomicrobiae bacterium]|nr:Multifunctional conjugation protein TraI [Verrucomicrobiae bacterium]